jgi:hypothetical protein
MKEPEPAVEPSREQLLRQIEQVARRVLMGNVSETYRT